MTYNANNKNKLFKTLNRYITCKYVLMIFFNIEIKERICCSINSIKLKLKLLENIYLISYNALNSKRVHFCKLCKFEMLNKIIYGRYI